LASTGVGAKQTNWSTATGSLPDTAIRTKSARDGNSIETAMLRRIGRRARSGWSNPLLAKNSQQIMVAGAGAGSDGGVAVPRVSQVLPWIVAAALSAAALPVHAQSNLDAGKSAAQIFAATCNACHRSPRELKQSSAGFLREHYTTGPREAAAMAAYLGTMGSDPRAVQQRRPPTLGAGQAGENAARGAEQGKPSETQAALPAATPSRRTPGTIEPVQSSPSPAAGGMKPRRPSESMEAGKLPVGGEGSGAEAAPSQTAIAAPARPSAVEDFEE
jgi:hypothetical protein